MIKPYFQTDLGKLYHGDCLEIMKQMPAESIDCVMTSPPYWALRDYGVEPEIWDEDKDCEHEWGPDLKKKLRTSVGPAATVGNNVNERQPREMYKGNCCLKCGAWKGSLGLEPTFQLYIQHLIQIFGEIKRVLKKTGICWVNIGDTYGGSCKGQGGDYELSEKQTSNKGSYLNEPLKTDGLMPKSLIGIPERFSIAMTDNGWMKRNTIIWEKPNCMPSSADDRFTVDFEYLYFFVKDKKYWFEQQFEKYDKPLDRWGGITLKADGQSTWDEGTGQSAYRNRNMRPNDEGRNKRCVWKIPTQPSNYEYCLNCHTFFWKSARKHIKNIIVDSKTKRQCPICKSTDDWVSHFAQYPEQLCYTPIKAGCPEYICKKCGKAREKVYEEATGGTKGHSWHDHSADMEKGNVKKQTGGEYNTYKRGNFIDYTDCGCNAGFESGIVLDPFMGAGTTLLVAEKLKRKNIGIEISKEYCDIAVGRIKKETAQYKLEMV